MALNNPVPQPCPSRMSLGSVLDRKESVLDSKEGRKDVVGMQQGGDVSDANSHKAALLSRKQSAVRRRQVLTHTHTYTHTHTQSHTLEQKTVGGTASAGAHTHTHTHKKSYIRMVSNI